MLAGFILEAAPAFVVQRELNDRAFDRHRVGLGVGEVLTGDDRARVEHVDRAQPAIPGAHRVDAPLEHLARGQCRLNISVREIAFDLGLIGGRYIVEARILRRRNEPCEGSVGRRGGRVGRRLFLGRIHRAGEERFDFAPLFGAVAAHIGRGGFGELLVLDDPVETRRHFFERAGFVGNLELEEGRLLHDVGGTSRIVNAGKFHDNAIGPHLLHHRFGHTELVDTGADHLQRTIERFGLVGDGAARLVDLEGQVHTPTEIEAELERDFLDRIIAEAIGTLDAFDSLAREERPAGGDDKRRDREQPVLQVRHSEAGKVVREQVL